MYQSDKRYAPVLVRPGFSEQDIWRDALGNNEPLRPFASFEMHLDAPDIIPAGSMRSWKYGPRQSPAWRPCT